MRRQWPRPAKARDLYLRGLLVADRSHHVVGIHVQTDPFHGVTDPRATRAGRARNGPAHTDDEHIDHPPTQCSSE